MEKNNNFISTTLSSIGKTPTVPLTRIMPPASGSRLYAKIEGLNPGGSVKDRPALYMIKRALENGTLLPGMTIIDSSSGNTGISYAMIGAYLGMRVKIYAPSNMSEERKIIMRLYGAELILTPAEESHDGAIKRANDEYQKGAGKVYFMPDQYNNSDNPLSHYETTAVELIEQTGGNIDFFATGIGTGGTILGVGKRLKEFNGKIKIIAVVPDNEMHGIEGWKYNYSLNFKGFDKDKIIDDFVKVDTEGSYEAVKRLIREEGLLCGFSSGANAYAVQKLSERYRGNFSTVLPDTGSRYLSTRVFSEFALL